MDLASREQINQKDKWNLNKLFSSDEEWASALAQLPEKSSAFAAYNGRLGKGPEVLAHALDAYVEADILAERLNYYAMLRFQENLADQKTGAMYAKNSRAQSLYAQECSFFRPQLISLTEEKLASYLASAPLEKYKTFLQKLLRYKAHTLSSAEEALLAAAGELQETPDQAFSALTDADMVFDSIETKEGMVVLTQSTYVPLLKNSDRSVRKKTYETFYKVYDSHKNTIAALYAGSVKQDLFNARIRGFASAQQQALFADNMPLSVYHNLIEQARHGFGALHAYYSMRRQKIGFNDLRLYDVYAPLTGYAEVVYTYDQAVETICSALQPLGQEYVDVLRQGLLGGWVDRYESKGKASGAFSAGSFQGDPYILINYKQNDIRSMFTLAHEAGHSMHSYYSVQNNAYQDYNYSIFEAETASTFNEALLFDYLMKNSQDENLKTYLLGQRVDDILATFFRQTMFAEYEQIVHTAAETGEALTLQMFTESYGKLLKDYFGPDVQLENFSNLESLRIPHFYRAFYVYKYATGISASLALSARVLNGGERERQDYLNFLKSGGSRYPLESLKLGGVDMSAPQPAAQAVQLFSSMAQELKTRLA